MKHLAARCGACLAAAILAVSWLVAPACAAVASELSITPVGSAPVIPKNISMTGMTPTARILHFDIVLRPRDPAGLNSLALGVSTPGSADYRRFLSVPQFAARFGQTSAVIDAVDTALRSIGLTPGPVAANGLVIPVSATFGRAAAALRTGFADYQLGSGRVAFANTSPPSLPAGVASLTSAVIGLNDLASPIPGAPAPANARPGARSPDTPASAGPQACRAAAEAAAKWHAWTYPQLAAAYRITALYRKHYNGSGRRIALVELEPWLPSDIATFQRCYGTHVHVASISIDGGAGTGPGKEPTLDIETAIALAPGARLSVYNAPPGDYARATIDLYTRIVDDDNAQVVSTSYSVCESYLNAAEPGLIAAENTLFEQAAAEGISVFAAAGDTGSEGCYRSTKGTELAVNDPASQPFVTAVGGTSLTAIHPWPTERAWNNGVTAAGGGAGGGGISSVWRMPRWQSGPGVIRRGSSGKPCRAAAGYCREVPDVSAAADPLHGGYIIRWDGQWLPFGGTSAATPLWAAMTADILSAQAPPGRAGFLDPLLYATAASWHQPSFNDITAGNNDYTGTHGGRYPARPGYDMATGLGTPIATRLAADILAGRPKL